MWSLSLEFAAAMRSISLVATEYGEAEPAERFRALADNKKHSKIDREGHQPTDGFMDSSRGMK